ncbi:MAG TPA: flagellar biosynthesis anti-sigma factor FlgM [Dissulfurispiraceae bacterium]|nr:flagellar biosynthesis anti-sigma factor FlgM [Dissulfurispiraceae bacterium]
MKIEKSGEIVSSAIAGAAKTSGKKIASESAKKVADDQVTLSSAAGQQANLAAAVQGMPDIRAEKVEAVRSALESGKYVVQGQAVAEKLLKEVIVDATL